MTPRIAARFLRGARDSVVMRGLAKVTVGARVFLAAGVLLNLLPKMVDGK
jgi:hypothetical protein